MDRADDVPIGALEGFVRSTPAESDNMTIVRILHVVARSHRRGAEQAAMELAHELDALGHANSVVALGLSHERGRDPALPPLVNRATTGVGVLLLAAWRLRRLLAQEKPDVLLAHGGWPVQVATLGAHGLPTLVVWQRILGFPDALWGSGRRWWWHRIARNVAAAVALTPELGAELRRLGFPGPVWVIPNSRRPERFLDLDRDEEESWLRQQLGLDDDVALIGFVGHLVVQKRPERAVEVLAEVCRSGRRAHLVVAGSGPLSRELALAARRRGLGASVTMLGHRSDVERILAAVDLLLLTSDAEGIPGIAIEAQMAGCPVVTFPLGGVAEVVEDGITGVVLPVASTALMAQRVGELLDEPERLRAMGCEARARAARFSATHAAKEYERRLGALHACALPASP